MLFCKQLGKSVVIFIFGAIIRLEVRKNMKKKYGLFKVLSVVLLLCVVITYFVHDRSDVTSYLALGDVFLNYLQSFYYFFDTALFILVVGGFYGVLNKIPAYKKMLKLFADKVRGKSKLFVVVITILLG